MNILLTCVGRRNYLVEFFRQAVGARGRIYGADVDQYACALPECDKGFIVPRVDDPGYADEILAVCRDHDVRLMIPLLDLELPVLARHRQRFLDVGTMPVVSPQAVVDCCFDKWMAARFLTDCGIPQPRTFLDIGAAREAIVRGQLRFPLVVKPRWGSASLHIEYPEDDEELEMTVRLLKKRLPRTILGRPSMIDPGRAVLIQERLEGQEYGLDVINDLCGRYVTTLVRRKLGMRAGETDQAVTVADARLAELGATLGHSLRHVGNLDCDVFVTDRGCSVLEMNPRFGGGYPFSHAAGANLPALLVAWATGAPVDERWTKTEPDVIGSKCDRIVTTHPADSYSQPLLSRKTAPY